jgi:precorrin-6B methylase 2
MSIINATAPAGLKKLPRPDKVFVGGSGGNLNGILELVFCKNPEVRL